MSHCYGNVPLCLFINVEGDNTAYQQIDVIKLILLCNSQIKCIMSSISNRLSGPISLTGVFFIPTSALQVNRYIIVCTLLSISALKNSLILIGNVVCFH